MARTSNAATLVSTVIESGGGGGGGGGNGGARGVAIALFTLISVLSALMAAMIALFGATLSTPSATSTSGAEHHGGDANSAPSSSSSSLLLAPSDAWLDRALALQRRLQRRVPLPLLQPVSTHNSFLSDRGYALCDSLQLPVQHLALRGQLQRGVRQIELDVYRVAGAAGTDGATAAPFVVCHPCAPRCDIALALCMRERDDYFATNEEGTFGCAPGRDLSLAAALRQVYEWVQQQTAPADEELVIVHLETHVGSGDGDGDGVTRAQVEDADGDIAWLRGLADVITSVVPRDRIVRPPSADDNGSGVASNAHAWPTVASLAGQGASVLLVAELLYNGATERAAPGDRVFTSPNSPLFGLASSPPNRLVYPDNLLGRVTFRIGSDGDDTGELCSIQTRDGDTEAGGTPPFFTYLVGAPLSTAEHIADAYRCGYAVRADMPTASAMRRALSAAVWSWDPASTLPPGAGGDHHRVYMVATSGRWRQHLDGGDNDHAARRRAWLCVEDLRDDATAATAPPPPIGQRLRWRMASADDACTRDAARFDAPRSGYENAHARAALRASGADSAWIGVKNEDVQREA